MTLDITKPIKGEYAEYYGVYLSLVTEGPVYDVMESQIGASLATLRGISEERSGFRSADGKWSIKEVVGHLIDTERVMAYRALAFARGDTSELPGMDQDQYVENALYDNCSFEGLVNEFEWLRKANVNFFKNLDDTSWTKGGVSSGAKITVRTLASIIAGHEIHHVNIIRKRYLTA